MTASAIESVSQAYGFEIICIDYAQLIVPESDRRANRTEQMAEISRSLHTFAQRTGTLVIVLSQLTRQDRSSGWREPDMHDLKESGQFEQDADIIHLLFRPNPKDKDLDRERHRILKIAKNKEGRRGMWPVYFDGAHQTLSILMDEGGRNVLRQLVDAGKAAKAKNKADAQARQAGAPFEELPDGEQTELPF